MGSKSASLERMAKALEVMAIPNAELLREHEKLRVELADAISNWRGWHSTARQLEERLQEARNLSLRADDLQAALQLRNEEYVRLEANYRRVTALRAGDADTSLGYRDLLDAEKKETAKLRRIVAELQRTDSGKVVASYERKLESRRGRIKTLTSRISYWKKKSEYWKGKAK